MKFTGKTFFALGIVASALNILGAVAFILGTNLGLLFTVASVLSAAMMMFLAGYEKTNRIKQLVLVAASLLSLAGTLSGIVGVIGGAFSWPAFAGWFLYETKDEEKENNSVRTMCTAVIVCGVVYFVGAMFMPLTQRIAGCLVVVMSAVQGVFAWVLYQRQKAIQGE